MKTFFNILLTSLLLSSCNLEEKCKSSEYEYDEAYWIPGESFGKPLSFSVNKSDDYYSGNQFDENKIVDPYSYNIPYYNYYTNPYYYNTYPYNYNYYNTYPYYYNQYNSNQQINNTQEGSNTTNLPRPSSGSYTPSSTPTHINRKPKEIIVSKPTTTVSRPHSTPRPTNTSTSRSNTPSNTTIRTKRP